MPLCQRVLFFENFEIVAISTDKNSFLMAILIKLTLDNIFLKVKKIRYGWAIVTKNKNKSLNSFISIIDAPLEVPGVSKDAPGSTKLEFGGFGDFFFSILLFFENCLILAQS
jgi:hypothetical protein